MLQRVGGNDGHDNGNASSNDRTSRKVAHGSIGAASEVAGYLGKTKKDDENLQSVKDQRRSLLHSEPSFNQSATDRNGSKADISVQPSRTEWLGGGVGLRCGSKRGSAHDSVAIFVLFINNLNNGSWMPREDSNLD